MRGNQNFDEKIKKTNPSDKVWLSDLKIGQCSIAQRGRVKPGHDAMVVGVGDIKRAQQIQRHSLWTIQLGLSRSSSAGGGVGLAENEIHWRHASLRVGIQKSVCFSEGMV